MPLTAHQSRAIELILEQQERFEAYTRISLRDNKDLQIYQIVGGFYSDVTERGRFEIAILNKIGRLLAPESTEDLNLVIRL